MKKCPYCAEEIQDAAVVCRFCQRDLIAAGPGPTVTASLTPAPVTEPVRKTSTLAWGCLSVVVLFLFVAWCGAEIGRLAPRRPASTASPSPVPSPAPAPVAETPKLALLSSRGYEEYGYHIVEGRVKNISTEPMKNVLAKAQWFDKKDAFIASDDALIDYNPILPGQTSPFKTMSRGNPEMSRYRVDFKEFSGGEILTEDQRKKK